MYSPDSPDALVTGSNLPAEETILVESTDWEER